MPEFSYKARDRQGNLHQGIVEAADLSSARERIREENLYLLELRQVEDVFDMLKGMVIGKKKVPRKELASFCRLLSTMLAAGVPIMSSLKIIYDQTRSKPLQEVLEDVIKSLNNGDTLAGAFRKQGNRLPTIMVSMTAAGEVGGFLDESLERLADHFEREEEVENKVKTALVYPKVILTISIAVVLFMVVFILPTYATLFDDMGIDLPLLTRILMTTSHIVLTYWYLLLVLLGLLYFAFQRYKQTPSGRRSLTLVAMRLPIVGLLLSIRSQERFARTLSTLVESGIPLLQALGVVKDIVDHPIFEEAIAEAEQEVQRGRSLSAPLRKSGVVSPMLVEMIAIGEESGSLGIMLNKGADFYTQDIKNTTDKLTVMIEPIMLAVLGFIVAIILLAIYIPMFESYMAF